MSKMLAQVNECYVNSWGGVGTKGFRKNFLRPLKVCKAEFSDAHQWSPLKGLNKEAQVIYMFGDPRNSVLSFFRRDKRKPGWVWLHCKNLHSIGAKYSHLKNGCDFDEFLKRGEDIFELEGHFDAWLKCKVPHRILFLKYEELKKDSVLEDLFCFLGIDGKHYNYLKKEFRSRWKTRSSNWKNLDKSQRKKLNKMYESLVRKVDALPGSFVKKGVS